MLGEAESFFADSTESEALEFIHSLPASDQGDFKFLDFTFYAVNESMKGGFDSLWMNFTDEVSQNNPFYMAFGRELGSSFRNRVEINLPKNNSFSCITEQDTRGLISLLNGILRDAGSIDEYELAKIKAISEVDKFVARNTRCCAEGRVATDDMAKSNSEDIKINVCVDGGLCGIIGYLKENEIAFITAEPRMPEIEFVLDYEENSTACLAPLKAELKITYKRQVPGDHTKDRDDETSFYIDDVKVGNRYKFDLGDVVVGGRAEIIIRDSDNLIVETFDFTIKGTNPKVLAVINHIVEKDYDVYYWFLLKLLIKESRQRGSPAVNSLGSYMNQFNNYQSSKEDLHLDWNESSRCPNMSNDGGWGFGQITSGYPPPEELWNWKKNIDAAVRFLNQKAVFVKEKIEYDYVPKIIAYETAEPSDPVEPRLPYEDGGVSWVHAMNNYFDINFSPAIDIEFDTRPLVEGEGSFLDAMIIKLYNGAPSANYYHIRIVNSKPTWSVRDYSKYKADLDGDGTPEDHKNYYVRDVSLTVDPTEF